MIDNVTILLILKATLNDRDRLTSTKIQITLHSQN